MLGAKSAAILEGFARFTDLMIDAPGLGFPLPEPKSKIYTLNPTILAPSFTDLMIDAPGLGFPHPEPYTHNLNPHPKP